MLKNTIKYQELPQIEDERIETTGIKIQTTKDNINLYAAYLPPREDMSSEAIKSTTKHYNPTLIQNTQHGTAKQQTQEKKICTTCQ